MQRDAMIRDITSFVTGSARLAFQGGRIYYLWLAGLAAEHGEGKTVMIDATDLKARRKATSMGVKRGAWASDWADQRWDEYLAARCL